MSRDQKSEELSQPSNAAGNGKKLLERAWEALLAAGFAEAAARQYVSWMRDYVLFHGKRHPLEMGVPEVRAFLADARFSGPAAGQRVEASEALRFLYEVVLQRHWPRGTLEGTGESGANRGDAKAQAVYLNGRQQGVKLPDRVRNTLRVGQYACFSIGPFWVGSWASWATSCPCAGGTGNGCPWS
jgi:hypothetical protein